MADPEVTQADRLLLAKLAKTRTSEERQWLVARHRIQAEKRNKALADELRALDAKATAGPWEVDTEKSEGEYGAGPDTTVGYDVSMIIGPDGLSLFDALNSTAASIQEEYDEDWLVTYDEVSARNAALIVALRNNLPAILAALEGDE